MTTTTISTRPASPVQTVVAKTLNHPNGLYQQMLNKIKTAGRSESANQDDDVDVDPALLNLVRLRVAQICLSPGGIERFWLDVKIRMESEELLEKLKVWRESLFFNDKEKAALTLAETVSLCPTKPIPEQCLKKAKRHFKKGELVSLLLAIMTTTNPNCLATPDEPEEITQTKPRETAPEQDVFPHWGKFAHQLTQRILLPRAEA
jgi:alkylhydroperoxidase family enzyme